MAHVNKTKIAFLFICFFSLLSNTSFSQELTVLNNTAMTIMGGTPFSVSGLVLTPSSDFTLNNISITISEKVTNYLNQSTVARVYKFSNTTNPFIGEAGIRYQAQELNRLNNADLKLQVHNGNYWSVVPLNSNDVNNQTTQSLVFSQTLNEITLTDNEITPTLNLILPDATLTSNCAGFPSTPTTFRITGSVLSSSVTISAPSNFEISTSLSGSYSLSLTLPQASTVSQTLYIRLSSTATTNGAKGTITATSSGLTTATTTISSTTVDAPLFSVTGPYVICSEGTYAISLTVPNSYNGWSTSSNAITVNSSGYLTAGTVTGTYSVSYSDACAQTFSATVNVATTSNLPSITDGQAAYKFNNNPQGPIGSGNVIYMGYNGFNYSSQTRPINTGFYKANNVSGSSAGCPYAFYIFSCTTCGTVSESSTRLQGSLSGSSIISQGATGSLTYTSSNGEGPFKIVYQASAASPVTLNNISSSVAFNVGTPISSVDVSHLTSGTFMLRVK